jgi:hypothetical protein
MVSVMIMANLLTYSLQKETRSLKWRHKLTAHMYTYIKKEWKRALYMSLWSWNYNNYEPNFYSISSCITFKQFLTKWTNIWDQSIVLTALLSSYPSCTTEILKAIALHGYHSMDHTNKFFYWLYDHFFGTSWLC